MLKKIFTVVILLNIYSNIIYAQNESPYSTSLSRMEREWLHKEYNEESDEQRINRLEENIFGTIHEIDKNQRYDQLRQAFDAKKHMQAKYKHNYLYGNPTSIPMNVNDLLGY